MATEAPQTALRPDSPAAVLSHLWHNYDYFEAILDPYVRVVADGGDSPFYFRLSDFEPVTAGGSLEGEGRRLFEPRDGGVFAVWVDSHSARGVIRETSPWVEVMNEPPYNVVEVEVGDGREDYV